ncbi:hypothetical protein [Streptomyces sp. H27-C3]|uniref:hypothetical protein n=1 Tax=Streptomyces sp. H27-C3 TaxID=3046305 RepID=UPI0024B92D89|nr:hypothetical protein [Streptomyces sp. H27-C3]MDJ0462543.1 hypothetical protein [Streptomyces sp. H27-C3]
MTTEHQLITGSTRLFGVIGDPVEQVQAPSMMNPLFTRLGIDAVLRPVPGHGRNRCRRRVGASTTSGLRSRAIVPRGQRTAHFFFRDASRGAGADRPPRPELSTPSTG